ncbi:MAG: gamma-glutamyltransferase family protein [Burkholderiaceae bacterium]|nr:gamma-glutamyltransferase family protein [Burkholderiaceae bacterium]
MSISHALPKAQVVWRRTLTTLAVVSSVGLLACTGLPQRSPDSGPAPLQPEAASGYTPKPGWAYPRFAVAAAHPLAVQAGQQMLQAGGTAIDAAVGVQMVLSLVEPQSSGIGGGAFLLYADGVQVQAYDGRETAPAGVHERWFLRPDGQPLGFHDAAVGGRAVGVPGMVRMLELAHREHGRLPWAALLQPAIALAEQGFAIGPRLHQLLGQDRFLAQDPVARAYFYDPHGQPWPIGHVLRNPELAVVLRAVAQHGAQALHEGPIAQAIVAKVQGHAHNPGTLNLADLATYQPRKRQALCSSYAVQTRSYWLCGFPPPSAGGIAVGQILGILQHTAAATMPLQNGAPSAQWLHQYHEAARLAWADRAQYVADPDFVPAPAGHWASLLEPSYLAERARLIGPQPMQTAPAGQPANASTAHYAPMPEQAEYGTSHISIADAEGHTLAMTSSIEDQFGARQMVSTNPQRLGGFLLNNQLTDFSFTPTDTNGQPIANRIEPGKRPRSSMAPTLVLDAHTGQVLTSAGSPGGALIIHYTAKALYGMLQWGLSPQQAIDLPNFGTLGGALLLETGRFDTGTVQGLQTQGSPVKSMAMTSGLHILHRVQSNGQPVWQGGADPRREGIVLGN